ncbi:hypothetical protein MESS2_920002 [Mesorhizobium metallidurans STM 2683]|uniref:Uncharacterized protein n=1 Tax=Mesorhizobium metallidurans STM 2683 TaxID=1297569 RepID=M5EYU3_9HYPH|nr:hypothetical protein MESS2_920002 [Mesorhizobium metallidurans STM 2683]
MVVNGLLQRPVLVPTDLSYRLTWSVMILCILALREVKVGKGRRNIASVHDIANRGLPSGIVESSASCDQEAEAEDHPRFQKAERHGSGQHRTCYRHQGEHDSTTAKVIGDGPDQDR